MKLVSKLDIIFFLMFLMQKSDIRMCAKSRIIFCLKPFIFYVEILNIPDHIGFNTAAKPPAADKITSIESPAATVMVSITTFPGFVK